MHISVSYHGQKARRVSINPWAENDLLALVDLYVHVYGCSTTHDSAAPFIDFHWSTLRISAISARARL
jgi:hypothetical protein